MSETVIDRVGDLSRPSHMKRANVKLTVLSGKRRGQTMNVSNAEFRLGAAEDCDLRFEDDHGVEPHHAELVEENCEIYLRRASPEARLAVNLHEIDEIILRDKDLIGLGLSGPRIRLRLPPEKFLHCKPITEICRDCIDMIKLADAPVYRKAGMAARHMTNELLYQTTRVFKVTALMVLIALLAGVGGYVSWSTRQFRQYHAALAQVAERSDRERRSLLGELSQIQETAKHETLQQQQRLRDFKESLPQSEGGQIQRLEKEVQTLRREFDFAPSVLEKNSGGVSFIIGTYGFVEKASGKSLRFAGLDSQGEPLKDASGQVHLAVGDQGALLTRSYTGSGFLISPQGQILTNRHVAEPWAGNETDQQIIQNGFEPRLLFFMAYFPGNEHGYALTVLKNSSTADVSLLQADLGEHHPPVLTLSRDKPRVGEPILLLGYPGGYDGLLARYSEETIKGVMAERPSSPGQLSQALARRNLIRPISTQGHLGDVLKDRLVYDAQTTHGGSGGPILNSRGEVIGINFAILESFSGSNFGVPVDQTRNLLSP